MRSRADLPRLPFAGQKATLRDLIDRHSPTHSVFDAVQDSASKHSQPVRPEVGPAASVPWRMRSGALCKCFGLVLGHFLGQLGRRYVDVDRLEDGLQARQSFGTVLIRFRRSFVAKGIERQRYDMVVSPT